MTWVGFLKTASGLTLCSYQINMSRTYLGSATCFLFAQCKHGQKWWFQKPYATICALQPKETFAAHNVISEKQWAITWWCFWSVSVSRDASNRCFLQKQEVTEELLVPRREILWLHTCALKIPLKSICLILCFQSALRKLSERKMGLKCLNMCSCFEH